MSQTETLDQIPKGRSVRVLAVTGDDPIARRLNDLGIREGTLVEVIRRAPLGDPTLFELRGYQLCLRRSESRRVHVTCDIISSATSTDASNEAATGVADLLRKVPTNESRGAA
jgi:ferrous iron transport protein A